MSITHSILDECTSSVAQMKAHLIVLCNDIDIEMV